MWSKAETEVKEGEVLLSQPYDTQWLPSVLISEPYMPFSKSWTWLLWHKQKNPTEQGDIHKPTLGQNKCHQEKESGPSYS